MARLAAIAKLGFVPTPDIVLDLLPMTITGPKPYRGYGGRAYNRTPSTSYVFFDPCCGEGSALNRLGSLLVPAGNVRTLGVELDTKRAAVAAEVLDEVSNSDAFNTYLVGGDNAEGKDKYCDLMLLNPPYEQVVTGAVSERYELEFLEHCLGYLHPKGGIMVYIVREPFLHRNQDELERITSQFQLDDIVVYRFPEPAYSTYQQVVCVGRRTDWRYRTENSWQVESVLGGGIHDQRRKPNLHYNTYERSGQPETKLYVIPDVPFERLPFSEFEQFFGELDAEEREFHPLSPLRDEHAILVASGGLLNGVPVGDFIIRGHSFKVQQKEERHYKDDKGETIKESILYDKMVHQLTMLNRDGTVTSYNDMDDPIKWQQAMLEYGPLFLKVAQERYTAYATDEAMAKYFPVLSHVQAPKVLPGRTEPEVLKQQFDRAAAILVGWENLHTITIGGEMSVGKTLISLMVGYTKTYHRPAHMQKIIAMVPATTSTVKKWVKEAREILGPLGARVTECRTKTQVDEAFAHPGLAVLVIPETAGKLRTGWQNIDWNQLTPVSREQWIECMEWGDPKGTVDYYRMIKECKLTPIVDVDGEPVTKRDNWRYYRKYRLDFGYRCPSCGKTIHAEFNRTKKAKCVHCLEPLWSVKTTLKPEQVANNRNHAINPSKAPKNVSTLLSTPVRKGQKGTKPKVALARYIRQHYSRQYVLIVDEVHEYKSGSSARSYAVADLMSGSYKCVQMTGTLSDGLSSSLFHIMYRSNHIFRDLYKHNEVQKFVQMYGLQETVTKYFPTYAGDTINGYREYTGSPSEIPGVHPGMIMLLLPSAVFLSLSDLDHAMPKYSEHTLFVKPSTKLLTGYRTFIDSVKTEAMEALRELKDRSLFAQWIHARYRVLDSPTLPDQIGTQYYDPPVMQPGEMYPKEEMLLRLLHREKGRSRPVLCFVTQMQRGNPAPRLLGLVEHYGMQGTVMGAEVSDRTEFIKEAVENGADIVFTSAPLVRVSVDIIETPTVVWYGVEFQTVIYPQANRRPYRLTQSEPVEIYYLAYQQTVQAAAFDFIAKKLTASQIFQGHAVSGLARIKGEDSFVRQLQDLMADENSWFDSDLSADDLPLLPGYAELKQVVPVMFLPKVMKGLPGTEYGVCFECFEPFNGTVEGAKMVSIVDGGPVYRVCSGCVRPNHKVMG